MGRSVWQGGQGKYFRFSLNFSSKDFILVVFKFEEERGDTKITLLFEVEMADYVANRLAYRRLVMLRSGNLGSSENTKTNEVNLHGFFY